MEQTRAALHHKDYNLKFDTILERIRKIETDMTDDFLNLEELRNVITNQLDNNKILMQQMQDLVRGVGGSTTRQNLHEINKCWSYTSTH